MERGCFSVELRGFSEERGERFRFHKPFIINGFLKFWMLRQAVGVGDTSY